MRPPPTDLCHKAAGAALRGPRETPWRAIRLHVIMSPLTSHQIKALRKLRLWGATWERAVIPGFSQATWDELVGLGYVEERREGPGNSSRFLRLTEEGMRAVDEADQR
jgi:hypothetical protein